MAITDNIVNDLEGTLKMLGQAQERSKPGTELYRQLGNLYAELDSLKEAIGDDEERYYTPMLKEEVA